MILTTFSPLRIMSPSARRCVASVVVPLVVLVVTRNSSVSESTRFMNLSKARKVPTRTRRSEMVTRRRESMRRSSLLLFPWEPGMMEGCGLGRVEMREREREARMEG